MALREIFTDDAQCLYKVAKKVEKFDGRLAQLLDDMAETMYHHEGVGLAANQVGILKRVVVIDAGDGLFELVNPTIISYSGIQQGYEGCLSFPGKRGYVERPENVVVRAFDRKGIEHEYSGSGLFARAVFHETDHLDGRVYTTLVTTPPEGFTEEEYDEDDE